MDRTETTAAFKRFSSSPRLDEPRFRYAHDARFTGFVKLLSDMLPDAITPAAYCELCEDLLSLGIAPDDRGTKEVESLVTRLVVHMQGCPPATPKLFSDRFTNAAITQFATRYLRRRRP